MKIKSLQLKNFKRFTDLTLLDIPEEAKLVLLIGSNGSGKSSVFDGLEILNKYKTNQVHQADKYYNKGNSNYQIIADFGKGWLWDTARKTYRGNEEVKIVLTPLYGRTSFRQIPRLSRTQLGQKFDIKSDNDRPHSFIDRDERFENDLEFLFGKLLREFFRKDQDKSEIKNNVIKPINDSFDRIFLKDNGTKIELIELIPPLEGKVAEITFKKGNSFFHYNFLSAGEKEVFNVLINLIARKEYYQGGILYFDEIDLHLNTRLQYYFLKEIVESWVIPANCQLWTASHSLGFIDYANDREDAIIFDFDDLDFDVEQKLQPKPKNDIEIFEIAVGKAFIDKFVQGRKIIFSENTDTPYYNDLGIENVLFFTAIDKSDVFHKAKNHKQFGLIDRDYLSDDEIQEIKKEYPFLYILPYYSFENLIFHPDNLEEYFEKQNKSFEKQNYIQRIIQTKNREKEYLVAGIIQARSGYSFFKENENVKKLKSFKENYKKVIDLLKSDDLNDFYKVFPMKDYATQLKERQHISKADLVKTTWFKNHIAITIIK